MEHLLFAQGAEAIVPALPSEPTEQSALSLSLFHDATRPALMDKRQQRARAQRWNLRKRPVEALYLRLTARPVSLQKRG